MGAEMEVMGGEDEAAQEHPEEVAVAQGSLCSAPPLQL